MEFAAAAGGGTEIDSERGRGLAWFLRSWLDRLGLDATKCAIIRVRGESMEPALPDGCSIMFDRSRQDRREHGIYVVRTNGGLIVKRAVKSGRRWELISENPAVAPELWPADAEVVGEVVWVAQTLVGPRWRGVANPGRVYQQDKRKNAGTCERQPRSGIDAVAAGRPQRCGMIGCHHVQNAT